MSNEEKTTESVSHPLEEVFNIEPQSTEVERITHNVAQLDHAAYDEKDDQIESQFDVVYQKALEAFETQAENAEMQDSRHSARNMEVAERFLNTALNAAKEKSGLKQHKDKLSAPGKQAETINNNLIVADRNELLKKMLSDDTE